MPRKTNQAKHSARVRASRKKSAKEAQDRVRLGKPPCIGDDVCGDRHLDFVCRKPAGHGGPHEGTSLRRLGVRRWKRVKQ